MEGAPRRSASVSVDSRQRVLLETRLMPGLVGDYHRHCDGRSPAPPSCPVLIEDRGCQRSGRRIHFPIAVCRSRRCSSSWMRISSITRRRPRIALPNVVFRSRAPKRSPRALVGEGTALLCADAVFRYDACIMNGTNGVASRDHRVIACVAVSFAVSMMMHRASLLR